MSVVPVRFVRTIVALLIAVGVLGIALTAQDRSPHRIVFEVTSADPQVWEAVLNNIENVQRALGIDVTEIRVVAHGKGHRPRHEVQHRVG